MQAITPASPVYESVPMGAQELCFELLLSPDSPAYSAATQELVSSPVSPNEATTPRLSEQPSYLYLLEVLQRRHKTDPAMHNGAPSWVRAITHSFQSEKEAKDFAGLYAIDESYTSHVIRLRADAGEATVALRPICSCCSRPFEHTDASQQIKCATCNLPDSYLCADCRKPVYTCQDAWLDSIYVCCHCAHVALVDKPMAHASPSSSSRFLTRRHNPLAPRRIKYTRVPQL